MFSFEEFSSSRFKIFINGFPPATARYSLCHCQPTKQRPSLLSTYSFLYTGYWKPFDGLVARWIAEGYLGGTGVHLCPMAIRDFSFFLPFLSTSRFHYGQTRSTRALVTLPFGRQTMTSATTLLEMYGNHIRRAGTGYYLGSKNSPTDLFADLICDLDRGRYLWLVGRRYSSGHPVLVFACRDE